MAGSSLPSAPSSRHASFSAASSGYFGEGQVLQQLPASADQPPMPQGLYYDESAAQQWSISPAAVRGGYHTLIASQQQQPGSLNDGLRIILNTPTPQQTLHSSPGSLLSCSSVSSQSSVDYFCQAPQQQQQQQHRHQHQHQQPQTPFESLYPLSPCVIPQFPTHQPQFYLVIHGQCEHVPFSTAPQQMWFDQLVWPESPESPDQTLITLPPIPFLLILF